MALIQMNPDSLTAKAAEVRTLRAKHDEAMGKLRTLIRALNEVWKGEAQDAFVAKFEDMQPTFTSFSESLEEYAKLMDTSAKAMRETDEQLKAAMQGKN